MQDRVRHYSFVCMACLVCAIGLTSYLWIRMPVIHVFRSTLLWFAVFAVMADLLAVNVSQARKTAIAPTSLLVWSATCILGPLWSMAVCGTGAMLGYAISGCCYYVARAMGASDGALQQDPSTGQSHRSRTNRTFREALLSFVVSTGSNWRTGNLFFFIRIVLNGLALRLASISLSAGLSGMVYHALGGHFLVQTGPDFSVFLQFALPFLALVVVSLIVEHGTYVATMVAVDPVPGAGRLYAVLLRSKIAVIEDVLPVWRGELFLVVVALLLSYLYIHVGIWGYILAITPVLALRDFFNQWVEEKAAYMDTITTLATYMQHYHPYTRGHLKRVADMSERLARELRLPAESVLYMRTAAFVHDIGKIGVSEEILDKTAKLTDEEWDRIKEHPVKGAEIISHLEFLEGMVDWVKYHHKWYNGAGYPANGDGKMPVEASIIAVADAFDAMTDDRELTLEWECDSCGYKPADGSRPRVCPECGAEKRRTYREPKPLDQAIDELRRGAGSQFDPSVVKAFLTMVARDGIRLDA